MDMNYPDKALHLAEKARERYPEHEAIRWLLIDIWIATGWEDEAERLFNELAEEDRNTSRGHLVSALLAEERGQYEDAMDLYRRAIDLDEAAARKVLRERTYRSAVDRDWREAHARGITAVPTFLANGRRLVGAQPYEALEGLITGDILYRWCKATTCR